MLVKSNERAGGITQLVLQPTDPEEEIDLPAYNLRFQGRYAVVTLTPDGNIRSVYIGQGRKMHIGTQRIRPAEGDTLSAFIDFTAGQPKVSTRSPLYLAKTNGSEVLYLPE